VLYGTASGLVAVRSTGTLVWTCPLPGTLLSAVAFGQGGIVYAATTSGLTAVSSGSGSVLWTFAAPAPASTAPATLALTSAGVVVFTAPCCLYAVDGQSGDQVWASSFTDPPLALAIAAGDVVVSGEHVSNGGGFKVAARSGASCVRCDECGCGLFVGIPCVLLGGLLCVLLCCRVSAVCLTVWLYDHRFVARAVWLQLLMCPWLNCLRFFTVAGATGSTLWSAFINTYWPLGSTAALVIGANRQVIVEAAGYLHSVGGT
jgi:hypothetical protein